MFVAPSLLFSFCRKCYACPLSNPVLPKMFSIPWSSPTPFLFPIFRYVVPQDSWLFKWFSPIFSVIFQFSGVHFSYFTLGHRGPVPGLTPSAAGPQGCRFGAQWPPLSCVPRERDEISNIPDFCEVSLTWLRSLYTRITLSTSIHVRCICLHMCKQA